MKRMKQLLLFLFIGVMMFGMYSNSAESEAKNPYMPLWEHIPDGEPYVFEDPDNPGEIVLGEPIKFSMESYVISWSNSGGFIDLPM